MKGDIGVIALVPDRWTDICMSRHQMISRLASHFPVVWVDPPDTWREFLTSRGDRLLRGDEWSTPVSGLDVLTPGWRHPVVYSPDWLRRMTLRSRLKVARARLLNRGADRIVLYLWRDEFEEAIDLVQHDLCVYHVDDEYTFSEMDLPNSARETRLLTRADVVIVHSTALLAKKAPLSRCAHLVPNGVDFEAYTTPRAEPADLAAVPRPRIGYVGVIKKQLDLGLLGRIARARPGYSFVLVGPVLNVTGKEQDVAVLRELGNVHWLGEKPYRDLPAYVQHLDVTLMCYEVNGYTKYIYPLKVHEYLAAGRPVVSSRIDSMLPYANQITLAQTDQDWLAGIDAALSPETQAEALISVRRSIARKHDWCALAARVAAIFSERLARPGDIAGKQA